MLDKYMFSYNYEESVLHNVNPVVKFVAFFLFVISCFFRFNVILFFVDMIWIFVLILLSNIKLSKYLMVVWNFKYFLIFIYILLLSKNMELVLINVIIFKITASILFYYLILFTTTKKDFTKGLGIIFGFNNIKRVANFFNKIYMFFVNFVILNNEKQEIYSIRGEDRIFISYIEKIIIFIRYLKQNIKASISKVKNDNDNMKYILYNDRYVSKYKYRSRLNVFDYIFILFYIATYVFYIIKVR